MAVGSANAAGEIAIECPAGEAGPQMSLRYAADALSVTDANGTTALSASIHLDPSGMFSIRGSGPMDAVMPEPAAFDDCLAGKLKEHEFTAADVDAVSYVANLCRLKLMPAGTLQKVHADLTATSIDPGMATLFIQRSYLTPSSVTNKPMQLDEWPLRNCNVLTGP